MQCWLSAVGTDFAFCLRQKEKARCHLRDTGLLRARGGLRPMSRAQGVRALFVGKQAAPQTGIPRMTGRLMPDLGARGLRGETARRSGAPRRTALIAIGHPP